MLYYLQHFFFIEVFNVNDWINILFYLCTFYAVLAFECQFNLFKIRMGNKFCKRPSNIWKRFKSYQSKVQTVYTYNIYLPHEYVKINAQFCINFVKKSTVYKI